MAKYEIKHSCGHTERVSICGTNVHGERDRKIAWLESRPCRECEAAEDARAARLEGLAELEGSPKQVAWASDIRWDVLDKMEGFVARMEDGGIAPSMREKADEIFAAMRAEVVGQESAKWFIEHGRHYDAREAFNRIAKEVLHA